MSLNEQLHVIPAPYQKASSSYKRMMLDKLIAVCILVVSAIYFWGLQALSMIAIAVITAIITEFIAWKIMQQKHKLNDGSAIIIGISFALLLPVGVPWWVVMLGVMFSILFGKMAFGGISHSPFSPVAVGYAMVNAAWGKYLNPGDVQIDVELLDPLTELKSYGVDGLEFTFSDFLFGNQLTTIGATSLAVILCVIAFLLVRRVLTIGVTFGYIIGIALCAFLTYHNDPSMNPSPLFVLSTGTVLLSLVLLLTDFAAIPTSCLARIVYGFVVGAIIIFIRTYTEIFDGTPLAILLATFLVPYCDMIRFRKNCKGGCK